MLDYNQWCEISLPSLDHNVKELKKIAKDTKIMAVLKANAYGHGLKEIGKRLDKNPDVFSFGVNSANEALELRKNKVKKPILVMGYVSSGEYSLLSGNDIEVVLSGQEMLDQIEKKFQGPGRLKVHIKIDTGLNRLGFFPEEVERLLDKIKGNKKIVVKGIMSHLAALEEGLLEYTQKQIKSFAQIEQLFADRGFLGLRHIGAASSLLSYPNAFFDMVRVGISLYGLWPSKTTRDKALSDIDLKPVMSFKSKIIFLKRIKEGSSVGYGCSFSAKKDMLIGVLPTGYYEGLDRRFSNKGEFVVAGQKMPIVGRICMNMSMVDLSAVADRVKIGDEVLIFGSSGDDLIRAEDFTESIGTIAHEITSKIPLFVPRFYEE
ncbi:alanine racemase [Candidatus Microgenomates bacterium]|nr:alanine racemase [Candidatus Microgenomates bacterium]